MSNYQPGPESPVLERDIGNLAGGARYYFPAGEIPLAVMSTDADVADLRLQYGVGVLNMTRPDGADWIGIVNRYHVMPIKIVADGAFYNIWNSGANQIDAIHILYSIN